MSKFEEGLKLLNECCDNKDNVISLSTIALDLNAKGQPRPVVRDVDAFYEDGVFYVSTNARSGKMLQIEKNDEVAFSLHFEGISGSATGENLGWVMKPENAELRLKIRKVFADWYDAANDESCEDVIILAIRIKTATVFKDHGAVHYKLDFVNKTVID